jgi:hypothetical protein
MRVFFHLPAGLHGIDRRGQCGPSWSFVTYGKAADGREGIGDTFGGISRHIGVALVSNPSADSNKSPRSLAKSGLDPRVDLQRVQIR